MASIRTSVGFAMLLVVLSTVQAVTYPPSSPPAPAPTLPPTPPPPASSNFTVVAYYGVLYCRCNATGSYSSGGVPLKGAKIGLRISMGRKGAIVPLGDPVSTNQDGYFYIQVRVEKGIRISKIKVYIVSTPLPGYCRVPKKNTLPSSYHDTLDQGQYKVPLYTTNYTAIGPNERSKKCVYKKASLF